MVDESGCNLHLFLGIQVQNAKWFFFYKYFDILSVQIGLSIWTSPNISKYSGFLWENIMPSCMQVNEISELWTFDTFSFYLSVPIEIVCWDLWYYAGSLHMPSCIYFCLAGHNMLTVGWSIWFNSSRPTNIWIVAIMWAVNCWLIIFTYSQFIFMKNASNFGQGRHAISCMIHSWCDNILAKFGRRWAYFDSLIKCRFVRVHPILQHSGLEGISCN